MAGDVSHPVSLYRYKMRLTQTQLGDDLGLTTRHVRQAEGGGQVPPEFHAACRGPHPGLYQMLSEFHDLLARLDFETLVPLARVLEHYRRGDVWSAKVKACPLSVAKARALRGLWGVRRPDRAVRGRELGLTAPELGTLVARGLAVETRAPGSGDRTGRYLGTPAGDARLSLWYYCFRDYELRTGVVRRVALTRYGFEAG